MKSKRFKVAIWGIFWVSVVFMFFAFKIPEDKIEKLAEIYQWTIVFVATGYAGAQTWTDINKKGGGNGKES